MTTPDAGERFKLMYRILSSVSLVIFIISAGVAVVGGFVEGEEFWRERSGSAAYFGVLALLFQQIAND